MLLQKLFLECSAALVLFFIKVVPLAMHLLVVFKFRITLDVNKSHIDKIAKQVVEYHGKNTFALVFGFNCYKQKVKTFFGFMKRAFAICHQPNRNNFPFALRKASERE